MNLPKPAAPGGAGEPQLCLPPNENDPEKHGTAQYQVPRFTVYVRHPRPGLAGGVDAKTLSGILGHTNASFTLDTYTHVTGDMQKQAANIVGDFITDILGEEWKPWQGSERTAKAPSA